MRKKSRIIRQPGLLTHSLSRRVLGTFDGDDVLFCELQHRMCHSIIRWMCFSFFFCCPFTASTLLVQLAHYIIARIEYCAKCKKAQRPSHSSTALFLLLFLLSFLFGFILIYVQMCERYMATWSVTQQNYSAECNVADRRHSCKCTRLCSIAVERENDK